MTIPLTTFEPGAAFTCFALQVKRPSSAVLGPAPGSLDFDAMNPNLVCLWKSKSQPGKLHRTYWENGSWRCTCRAGRKGSCWHITCAGKLEDAGEREQIDQRHGAQANWI